MKNQNYPLDNKTSLQLQFERAIYTFLVINLAGVETKNFAGAESQTSYRLTHLDVLWDHKSICRPINTCIITSLVEGRNGTSQLKIVGNVKHDKHFGTAQKEK